MRRRYEVSGRTVLITGAARGIGAVTARRLHAKGAKVSLVGLEPELLEQLASELGERAAFFEADTTDYAALCRAVAATVERFGGIDVAIANAGIQLTGALTTAPMERVERVLEVNLLGVWRTDRAVLPELVKSGGYLLNISSLSAIVSPPLLGPYAISKAGVETLSNCLRVEAAPSGVAVGCAYFGFIDTDLVRKGFATPSVGSMAESMPGFIRRASPLPVAIDAIERGIERRSGRVWAPRFVGPMMALRGIVQPLVEIGAKRDKALPEALRLADPEVADLSDEDLTLGIAVGGRQD